MVIERLSIFLKTVYTISAISCCKDYMFYNMLIEKCKYLQAFAENFFNLFDTDGSGSVSLQELMGGMGRLVR